MGVYYIIVNDSKKEYVDPFDFGDNIKLGGVMQGLHGQGVVNLLVHPNTNERYKMGYWSGDSIRVLGDNQEDESERVRAHYSNISYYILANVFEDSIREYRDQIIKLASENSEILDGLNKVNSEFKYKNLNYSLNKLVEAKT